MSKKTMGRERLSREVAAILNLPYDRRAGEAYNLTNTIIGVIVAALQRYEEVRVKWFGTFYVYPKTVYAGPSKKPTTRHYVHFRPAADFLRKVNNEYLGSDNTTT
jgi:nucleoid DNA-binding protein